MTSLRIVPIEKQCAVRAGAKLPVEENKMRDSRNRPTRQPLWSLAWAMLVLLAAFAFTGCDNGAAKAAECWQEYTNCVAECDTTFQAAQDAWRQCKEDSKEQLAEDLANCRELSGQERADCMTDALNADAARKEACGDVLAAAMQAHIDCRNACGAAYNACVGN